MEPLCSPASLEPLASSPHPAPGEPRARAPRPLPAERRGRRGAWPPGEEPGAARRGAARAAPTRRATPSSETPGFPERSSRSSVRAAMRGSQSLVAPPARLAARPAQRAAGSRGWRLAVGGGQRGCCGAPRRGLAAGAQRGRRGVPDGDSQLEASSSTSGASENLISARSESCPLRLRLTMISCAASPGSPARGARLTLSTSRCAAQQSPPQARG